MDPTPRYNPEDLSPELREIGTCIVLGWKQRLERGIIFGPLPSKRLLSPEIPTVYLHSEEIRCQFQFYLHQEIVKHCFHSGSQSFDHWRLEPTTLFDSTEHRFNLVVYPTKMEVKSKCMLL